jgi:aspartate kinase
MKFGGTSLQDAECIRRAVEIVKSRQDRQPLVVVSAIGSTTKALLHLGDVALEDGVSGAATLLEDVAQRHREILKGLNGAASDASADDTISTHVRDITGLLQGISLLQELTPRTQDAIIAHGEHLSSLLFLAAARDAGLDAVSIDARTVVITDARFRAARPDRAELGHRARNAIAPVIEQNRIPVVEGFIGATPDGITTTMGFEASDYTASLLGAALDATEIQIWTDVGGMLTTGNPQVENVLSIRELSFDEAAELSFFGAKVLHPNTIEPAAEKDIPVRVLHSRCPEAAGTTISGAPHSVRGAVKSIAVQEDVVIVRLRPRTATPIHRTLWSIGEALDRHEVSPHLMTSSGSHVVLVVPASQPIDSVLAELGETLELSPRENGVIVSLVGHDVLSTPEIASRATKAIEHVPILVAPYGAADTSLSFVVPPESGDGVTMEFHRIFFGGDVSDDLFVPTSPKTGT